MQRFEQLAECIWIATLSAHRSALIALALTIVIFRQKLNRFSQLLVRSVQFRVRDLELAVLVVQDCRLRFETADMFLLALAKCALSGAILRTSTLEMVRVFPAILT